jgi:helicase
VYNLEVEEHSSYVGSFVVHNSAGVNLPARRVVVADLARYDGSLGMNSAISVLDYRQMAGRAGRPQYDDYGETVMVPSSSLNPTDVLEHYALGEVEPIESKLGEDRGMRVHLLAAIATSLGVTRLDIDALFSKTLLAAQVGKEKVQRAIDHALGYLISERLVAEKGNLLYATDFGKRVSTLYIDPVTGVLFRNSLRHSESVDLKTVGLLHLIAKSPDFEPKFPLREKNYETAYHFLEEHFNELIHPPDRRSFLEYDEILQDMRTVLAIHYWIEEWKEDELLEKLGIEPGDLHRAVDSADWLLYSLGEIAKLDKKQLTREIEFLRKRVNNGVKAELVELTTLQGIGRARARSLFGSGYRSIKALREASAEQLARVERIGPALAKRIKDETAG